MIYENKPQGNIRTQKALNREYAKPLAITEELQKVISELDVLFFAPLTPDYSSQYVARIMKSAKKSALKILIPQGYYRSFDREDNVIARDFREAEELIVLFNFVIVSEQDHKDMETIAKNWAKKTRVVMTLGDKGTAYLYKNEFFIAPVKPVKPEDIIDSVGSGDIFSASFGYKYYLTKDVKESLQFANNIARQCLFYPSSNLQFRLPN